MVSRKPAKFENLQSFAKITEKFAQVKERL